MRNRYLVLFFCLFIVSCKRNKPSNSISGYHVFSFDKTNYSSVIGGVINKQEEGEFLFSSNNELVMKGEFKHGLKYGDWNYIKDSIEIRWKIFSEKDFKVNVPNSWFPAVKGDNLIVSNIDGFKNSYFSIGIYELTDEIKTIDDYIELFSNDLYSGTKVQDYIEGNFMQNNKVYYYKEYLINDDNIDKLLFSLKFEHLGHVIDYIYIIERSNLIYHKHIFYDAFTSGIILGERVFSPLDDVELSI